VITKWRLSQFKSVEEQSVPLRPLTIISGANSSGKSSLLQSMTLVAQTLSNQIERRSLLFNGHLISLGRFEDVCSKQHSSFLVGWELEPDDASLEPVRGGELEAQPYATRNAVELKRVSCEIRFDSKGHDGVDVVQGTFSVEPTNDSSASCSWVRASPVSAAGEEEQTWKFDLDAVSLAEVQRRYPNIGHFESELRHFLPSRLRLRVSSSDLNADYRTQVLSLARRPYRPEDHPLLQDVVPETVTAILRELVPASEGKSHPRADASFAEWFAWLNEKREIAAPILSSQEVYTRLRMALAPTAPSAPSLVHTHLPGRLPHGLFYAETFFSTKFRYLGPLRDEPRSVYPHPTKLDPVDLGRRGEFTAAAYHSYQNEAVHHLHIDELEKHGPGARIRRATLKEAVNEWLQYIGAANHVSSREDKHGHVLHVGTAEEHDWDMIHVGTGVSQLLPVLVLGLLAQLDDTLVIEHPELHLHPRLQTRLADFFLFLALTRRQVLVETHSEYIINRLRYRIVAPGGEVVRDKIGIVFADLKKGATTFSPVSVNEYGAIDAWPIGFFDEGANEAERILRAALDREGGDAE
jgi:predicted ATPase